MNEELFQFTKWLIAIHNDYLIKLHLKEDFDHFLHHQLTREQEQFVKSVEEPNNEKRQMR